MYLQERTFSYWKRTCRSWFLGPLIPKDHRASKLRRQRSTSPPLEPQVSQGLLVF